MTFWEWFQNKSQIDIGNVAVAMVTLFVVFATLSQTNKTLAHQRALANSDASSRDAAMRADQKWNENRELLKEVADFIVDIQIARNLQASVNTSKHRGESALSRKDDADKVDVARLSAFRRSEYLKLRLSHVDLREALIRDKLQEMLVHLDPNSDGGDFWNSQAALAAAVRKYVFETPI